MAKKGLNGRHRDRSGHIDKKHGNTRVRHFAKLTATISRKVIAAT